MEQIFEKRFGDPELIGEGGMGSVYRVDDPRLARKVAIKVHRLGEHQDPVVLQRFIREAQTTGRLEHPAIPPVYEYGETIEVPPTSLSSS